MTREFTQYLINCQISRIVALSIGFIGCLVIAYNEIKHRSTLKKDEKYQQKWLLLFATLTIFASSGAQILIVSEAIPTTLLPLCHYTGYFATFFWFCKLLFLGLYQIRRLQIIFGKESIPHASAISIKLIAKALYCGAAIILFVGIAFLFAVTPVDYGEYGCILSYSEIGAIINWIWMFVYLSWDGTTLVVYIWKLSEYRKSVKISKVMNAEKHENTQITDKLYGSIKTALSKVILLTIMYEATSTIVGVLVLLDRNVIKGNKYIGAALWSMIAVDNYVTTLVIYLMQSQNRRHYFTFLKVLNKLKLTMYCKTLAHDASVEYSISMGVKTRTLTTSKSNSSKASVPKNDWSSISERNATITVDVVSDEETDGNEKKPNEKQMGLELKTDLGNKEANGSATAV